MKYPNAQHLSASGHFSSSSRHPEIGCNSEQESKWTSLLDFAQNHHHWSHFRENNKQ
jgi:hypothetical protein